MKATPSSLRADARGAGAVRACEDKHRFPTRAVAALVAARARRRPRYAHRGQSGRAHAYHCRVCGGWHVGAYAVRKPRSLALWWRRIRRLQHWLPTGRQDHIEDWRAADEMDESEEQEASA